MFFAGMSINPPKTIFESPNFTWTKEIKENRFYSGTTGITVKIGKN